MTLCTAARDVTRRVPIVVSTSPAEMPARAAGDPGTTRPTRTPAVLLSPFPAASATPRNAVGPTWTVDERRPAAICRAMDIAVSIGIANPSLPGR